MDPFCFQCWFIGVQYPSWRVIISGSGLYPCECYAWAQVLAHLICGMVFLCPPCLGVS